MKWISFSMRHETKQVLITSPDQDNQCHSVAHRRNKTIPQDICFRNTGEAVPHTCDTNIVPSQTWTHHGPVTVVQFKTVLDATLP